MIHRILSLAYYLIGASLAVLIVVSSGAAAQDYASLYERFTPSSRADAKLRSVLEALSLGLYTGASDNDLEIEKIVDAARAHELSARVASWGLLALSLLFLGLKSVAARAKGTLVTRGLTAHVLGVSIIFLLVGLLAPILSLVAYTELAVLGKVVFRYESKGILTTVLELIGSGNGFIALVLFVFSVVTPAAKLVLTFMAIESPDPEVRRRYVAFVSMIGKWSMADVLVVAILLSFFITGADEFSESWLGPGLYFFCGYCLLSLTAVQLITHLREGARREAPPPAR